MSTQRTKPDVTLLAAGWERKAETDEYRQTPDAPWLSLDAARIMAFGAPVTEAELSPAPIDATIIALLTDIVHELKEINRKLGATNAQ